MFEQRELLPLRREQEILPLKDKHLALRDLHRIADDKCRRRRADNAGRREHGGQREQRGQRREHPDAGEMREGAQLHCIGSESSTVLPPRSTFVFTRSPALCPFSSLPISALSVIRADEPSSSVSTSSF